MRPSTNRLIMQGLTAGVIGFVTVALVFAVLNLFAGRSPLFTSALLGAAMFHGVTDVSEVRVTAENVLAYNGVHLLVFLAFGILLSALASLADRGRQLWYVSFFALLFFSFHLEGAVQGFAAPMRGVLPDAAIWGGGLAASAAMAAYLLWMHPRIRTRQEW